MSDDSTVIVKQIAPALGEVVKEGTTGELRVPEKLKISREVYAQWNGADEPDVNIEILGKDGKFDWVCTVPAQGKIDMFLRYEVISPPRTDITGL
jgi:hypothetical protein